MADVTGPISTLPGSRHRLPPGATCDEHPERPAVIRIQGETDSFGSEMFDACQECKDKFEQEDAQGSSISCESCSNPNNEAVRPVRDPDEGMAGPVYYKCGSCRKSLFDYHREREDTERY